jgi:hypothetical protein
MEDALGVSLCQVLVDLRDSGRTVFRAVAHMSRCIIYMILLGTMCCACEIQTMIRF